MATAGNVENGKVGVSVEGTDVTNVRPPNRGVVVLPVITKDRNVVEDETKVGQERPIVVYSMAADDATEEDVGVPNVSLVEVTPRRTGSKGEVNDVVEVTVGGAACRTGLQGLRIEIV